MHRLLLIPAIALGTALSSETAGASDEHPCIDDAITVRGGIERILVQFLPDDPPITVGDIIDLAIKNWTSIGCPNNHSGFPDLVRTGEWDRFVHVIRHTGDDVFEDDHLTCAWVRRAYDAVAPLVHLYEKTSQPGTDDLRDCPSYEHLLTHELGHVLGLLDVGKNCPDFIMYPQMEPAVLVPNILECKAVNKIWFVGDDLSFDPCFANPFGEECWSPVLLDLDKDGFDFTGSDDPVTFDIDGDGADEAVAWTEARSDDAFLALDRNGNSTIDGGAELFGGATLLFNGEVANNGYEALAEFDTPLLGGNDDGVLDRSDLAWPELLLWTDENHNGRSEPKELVPARHVLRRISVEAFEDAYADENGNLLVFWSWYEDWARKRGWAVDAYFQTEEFEP